MNRKHLDKIERLETSQMWLIRKERHSDYCRWKIIMEKLTLHIKVKHCIRICIIYTEIQIANHSGQVNNDNDVSLMGVSRVQSNNHRTVV